MIIRDAGEVWEQIRPTPERVKTAKASLARELRERHATKGYFPANFAVEQGATHRNQIRDPYEVSHQPELIRFWMWELAGREALWDFQRQGLIVPQVTRQDTALPADRLLSLEEESTPRIPVGEPGERVPHLSRFPVTPVYESYALSTLGRAEIDDRLPLYDADLYLVRAELDVFGERARRCAREALACYRADLFLAAANMLGAASEAAWVELAEHTREEELQSPYMSIAKLQSKMIDDLRNAENFRERFGFPRGELDGLAETARFWREARNYGMHPREPEDRRFTDASLATQLMGATDYFAKLAQLLRGVKG